MLRAKQQQRKSKAAGKDTVASKKSTPIQTTLTSGTSTPHCQLQQVQFLLVQIWHRNKNQHRTQKWWKWVGILRRGVRDLVALDKGLNSGVDRVPDRGVGEAEKVRRRMEREKERREERKKVEEWVREVVVGRAWLAFSTLVADSQFSTLGVVLLAILARVGRLVGLPEPLAAPVLKPGQIAKVVLATSLKETGDDRGELVPRVYGSEDVGEVISREVAEKMSKGEDRDLGKVVDGQLDDVGDAAVSHESRKEARRHEVAEADLAIGMERKKKRRKKGNAIDDLFAGL